MYIIYTDGSSKTSNNLVIGVVVAKLNQQYKNIDEVTLLYKNQYPIQYNNNLHEILAIFECFQVIKDLKIENEPIVIINDSIVDTNLFNDYKKNKNKEIFNFYVKKIDGQIIANKLNELEKINLENIYCLRLPRTTLGINIADFLNNETHTWLKEHDKHFFQAQVRKLKNKPFDFNISSKKEKNHDFAEHKNWLKKIIK